MKHDSSILLTSLQNGDMLLECGHTERSHMDTHDHTLIHMESDADDGAMDGIRSLHSNGDAGETEGCLV